MRIIINYDLINAIRNVNEPLGTLKIVRNDYKKSMLFPIPELFAINIFSCSKDIYKAMCMLGLEIALIVSGKLVIGNRTGKDIYKIDSKEKLEKLIVELNKNNINTDYALLTNSILFEKKHKFSINEKMLPQIMETKYILVPQYVNNMMVDRLIKQEHIVGSNKYVLSISEPVTGKELVYNYK